MPDIKESKDCLFSLMIIQLVIIKFLLILSKIIFFQELKQIKQCNEIRKISTGQGDDYTTGCLLDFAYFEKNYRPIAADLSKQKALDPDSIAIQQIIFTGKIKSAVANATVIIFYILEQSKETIVEFAKGTTKVL